MAIMIGVLYGIGWLTCIFALRPRVAKEYRATEFTSPHANDAYTALLALFWPVWILVGLFSLAGRIGRR